MTFQGKESHRRLANPMEEMLLYVLIAWAGAIAVLACALVAVARRADAQSDAQWERWAQAKQPPPPLRSRRGGLAA